MKNERAESPGNKELADPDAADLLQHCSAEGLPRGSTTAQIDRVRRLDGCFGGPCKMLAAPLHFMARQLSCTCLNMPYW